MSSSASIAKCICSQVGHRIETHKTGEAPLNASAVAAKGEPVQKLDQFSTLCVVCGYPVERIRKLRCGAKDGDDTPESEDSNAVTV